MRTPSRRLLLLLCAALLGVLLALGLAVAAVAGLPGVLVYVGLVVVLVSLGAVRGRRLLTPPLPAGRTCTCCTTTHFDPVKVL